MLHSDNKMEERQPVIVKDTIFFKLVSLFLGDLIERSGQKKNQSVFDIHKNDPIAKQFLLKQE